MDRIREGYPDIAFFGGMGGGKTTAAKFLESLGYQRWSFAGTHKGGIRDVALRIWGEAARNDREKLIAIGDMATTYGDPQVWGRNVLAAIEADGHKRPAVLDDLRRPIEWRMLKAAGFVLVRVESEEWRRVDRLKQSGKWQHEAQLHGPYEVMLAGRNGDYTVRNNGSVDDFEEQLLGVLKKARARNA